MDRLPPQDLPRAAAELETIDAIEMDTWQHEIPRGGRRPWVLGLLLLVAMTWSIARFGGIETTPWWFLLVVFGATVSFVCGMMLSQRRRATVLLGCPPKTYQKRLNRRGRATLILMGPLLLWPMVWLVETQQSLWMMVVVTTLGLAVLSFVQSFWTKWCDGHPTADELAVMVR